MVEEKLCKMIRVNDIMHAQLEHFAKCSVDELKAFILARRDDIVKSKLPNKDNLAAAIIGTNCLIKLAFDCRAQPNIMLNKLSAAVENERRIGSEDQTGISKFSRHEVIVHFHKLHAKASTYLSNEDWLLTARIIFDPSSDVMINEVNDEMCIKADKLQNALLNRLTNHVHRRIREKKKMEHWCLKLAANNFGQMAALMVLCNHIKDDLGCLDNNATLLKTNISFVRVVGAAFKKQGAYLHYDNNNNTWIRSGKVTGRGMDIRDAEHLKKARAKSATSRFYLRYPTKDSVRCNSNSRKGFFDNLTQYVGLGFEIGNEDIDTKLSSGLEEGGIFIFNENEKTRMDASKKAGRNTTALKRIDVIAYLIEMAYDLAISPINNVSESPGFESCLNIY